ncbi:HAMP domain-containing sensor histidine kinase [Streptomyces sp. NPDC047000]|uniref:sensor histidine kinase n=1 Tax=Streptomyces sp. NPDC047000 TaxID=3155474 RepID=UPI0033F28867
MRSPFRLPRPFASVRSRAALAATLVVSVALIVTGIAVTTVLRDNLTDRATLESEIAARTVAGSQQALNGDFGTGRGSPDLPDAGGRLVRVTDSTGAVLAASDDAVRRRSAIPDYAPAPRTTATPSPTATPAATPTSVSSAASVSSDDHGHRRGRGKGGGEDGSGGGGDDVGDDSTGGSTPVGDDSYSTPPRGEVGTAVVVRTVPVRLPDGTVRDYRFAAVQGTTYDGRTYTVYAGTSLADAQAVLDQVEQAMLVGLPFLLLVVAGVTWLVTRRALRPVEGIRAEMAEITGSGDLTRRVPEPASRDEIARLARTTNETLAALQASVDRQHRFVADASHELRSPIASLRTQIEVADQHPGLLDTKDLHQDVVRLQHLAADLLLLARLDAGEQPAGTAFDLTTLLHEELAQRPATDRVTPVLTVPDDPLEIRGSRSQLSRVLANLVDNAQRHAATAVTVTAARTGGTVTLTVADDGDGVPPSDRERIFERFVRLDEARSRDEGGAGLGLAIARDVVHRHSGTLTVTDSPVGGAAFRVTLPACGSPAPGAGAWLPPQTGGTA